jgi:hypothetical protein
VLPYNNLWNEGITAMADIFISHIHEEAEVALALKLYFEEQMTQVLGRRPGIFVSSDRWQMRPGNWLERIRKELDSATIVILVLSKRSIERPWVNFEAGAAWWAKPDKAMIPVCFGDLKPGEMRKPYSDLTAWDLEERLGAYHALCKALEVLHPSPWLSPPPDQNLETLRCLERAIDDVKKKATE